MDNEKKDPEETIKIGLDKESAEMVDKSIQAGDLISAHECGYHRGYMRAVRDASMIILAAMMVAMVLQKTSAE